MFQRPAGSTAAARQRSAHRLEKGYTLLRLKGTRSDTAALEGALRSIGAAPFAVLDIHDERGRDIYGYDLLLLRPNLHVVWRGNRPPDNLVELAAIATGHHANRGRSWNE